MKIESFVKDNKPRLENYLTEYLNHQKIHSPKDLPYLSETIDLYSHFILNGKMIRGLLILIGATINGDKHSNEAVAMAGAIEIIHSTLLIHDDIMDNDRLRRGNKALFAHYEEKGESARVLNPHLYGQSMAICVGDVGFFLAYELISTHSDNPKTTINLIKMLSRELQYVGAMQMSDVDLGMRQTEPTEEEILSVYRYKTGRYTISLPLTLGAKLTRAPKNLISSLDSYGEDLGILFQLRDDELSIFGGENVTGKPIGSDIRENKKTLIRHLLFKFANERETLILKTIFGNKDIGNKEIEIVKKIFDSSQAKTFLSNKVSLTLNNLHNKIDTMPINTDRQELLHSFTDYIITRNK